jgi:hypothetical protein
MDFSTKVPIAKFDHLIDYKSIVFSIGSCFAENIGNKFDYFKFQITTNPFGIIFNPVAIENLISRVVTNQKFTEDDIFFYNDLWHCFEVHSALSHPDKEEMLQNLNQILEHTKTQIVKSTHVIITYGTSWAYRDKTANAIVANCHKVPQNQFEKELLSIETIKNSITNTIGLIQSINPNGHFIFTISPVRHIKDGFIANQLSKSHLIASLQSVVNTECHKQNSHYFPSYEIMIDELRDYRFYAQDMLHPSQIAIDYIWECFSENYIAPESNEVMQQVLEIQKALRHKSFMPNSESHKQFLIQLKRKISILQEKYPAISF